MNILYASLYNAKDKRNWSGTGYYISNMLKRQGIKVDYIGPLETTLNSRTKIYRKLCKIFNKKYHSFLDSSVANNYAQQVLNKINKNTDIIFAPGSTPIALLNTNKPKVYYTDATFASLHNFYNEYSNLSQITIKNGYYLEHKSLESSKLILFSSEWAANAAIKNYKVDPRKIKVVPFGANLECNRTMNDIKTIINLRSKKKLQLLFLGVDWVRKGGDVALAITEKLNEMGIDATLNVVGITELPLNINKKYIMNYGFINKTTKDGVDKLEKLLISSHFLLLPTIADCTPIVYSEVNSFGIPVITTNVGGITTVIKDNVNGMTFGLNSEISEWANYISKQFINSSNYENLCLSSFNEYETRLNWEVSGKKIYKLLKDL